VDEKIQVIELPEAQSASTVSNFGAEMSGTGRQFDCGIQPRCSTKPYSLAVQLNLTAALYNYSQYLCFFGGTMASEFNSPTQPSDEHRERPRAFLATEDYDNIWLRIKDKGIRWVLTWVTFIVTLITIIIATITFLGFNNYVQEKALSLTRTYVSSTEFKKEASDSLSSFLLLNRELISDLQAKLRMLKDSVRLVSNLRNAPYRVRKCLDRRSCGVPGVVSGSAAGVHDCHHTAHTIGGSTHREANRENIQPLSAGSGFGIAYRLCGENGSSLHAPGI
jgi:hypothetical protein